MYELEPIKIQHSDASHDYFKALHGIHGLCYEGLHRHSACIGDLQTSVETFKVAPMTTDAIHLALGWS